MITIHIDQKQYTKHHKLIIKLQKALAGMDTTTPQAAYNRRKRATTTSFKQGAAAGMEEKETARWNRFVEFTNVDRVVCVQVVSGTEAGLEEQMVRNKGLKPKWLSGLLEQGGMATMAWQMENEPQGGWASDTSNSWRVG